MTHVTIGYVGTKEQIREAAFADTRAYIGVEKWVMLTDYLVEAAWGHARAVSEGHKRSLKYDKSVIMMLEGLLAIAGVSGLPVTELQRVYLETVHKCIAIGAKVRPGVLKIKECKEALELAQQGKPPTHTAPPIVN